MQPESIRSIIEQARRAWIEGNSTAFSSLFCADGEFIVPGNRWVGREEIEKAIAEFAATHSAVNGLPNLVKDFYRRPFSRRTNGRNKPTQNRPAQIWFYRIKLFLHSKSCRTKCVSFIS
ncbi:MAG: SgcJ/EcaC family oxidoreductase [Cyanobacteriota bacterium]|nr:SgcJ/EcaC family oxidoreductase [Cyanobacteriota bacterium]